MIQARGILQEALLKMRAKCKTEEEYCNALLVARTAMVKQKSALEAMGIFDLALGLLCQEIVAVQNSG